MSDQQALLAAVVAHPDDDLPRLVYADWCDDHGLPLQAEFIRLQIELARQLAGRDALGILVAPELDPLFDRQERLLRTGVARPVPEPPYVFEFNYRRGFPEEARMTMEHASRQSRRVCRMTPVTRVGVQDIQSQRAIGALLARLARQQVWTWLRHLGVSYRFVNAAGLRTLTTSPTCQQMARVTIHAVVQNQEDHTYLRGVQTALPPNIRLRPGYGMDYVSA